MVLESVDKFFLNSKFGSELSGIYYIAITFAYIFSAGKEAVINAFTPWMFKSINTEKEATISRTITYIFFVAGIFAVAISWFSKEALTILSSNTDFIIAYRYIPFTVLGMYIIFLGQLYNIKTYFFSKHMKYLTATTVLGIVVDLIACFILVEKFGVFGAVISRVLAYSAHVVGIIVLSVYEQEKRKIYNERVLFLILIGVAAFLIVPLLDNETIYFLILKIIVYTVVVSVIVYITNKKFGIIEKMKTKYLNV
jgi:O-antigen/teichoic acid export membrane protein